MRKTDNNSGAVTSLIGLKPSLGKILASSLLAIYSA
jgi:hypothetical protein